MAQASTGPAIQVAVTGTAPFPPGDGSRSSAVLSMLADGDPEVGDSAAGSAAGRGRA